MGNEGRGLCRAQLRRTCLKSDAASSSVGAAGARALTAHVLQLNCLASELCESAVHVVRLTMDDDISQVELCKCLSIVVETRLIWTHDQTIVEVSGARMAAVRRLKAAIMHTC